MYLYLIEAINNQVARTCKIGIATCVEDRLAQLQTGNQHVLEILDVFEFENAKPVEAALHQKFGRFRLVGEWFELADFQIEEIRNICLSLGGNDYLLSTTTASTDEIEEAEEEAEGGTWYELVKVKNYYYLREMGWDKTTKKKVYIRSIGSLEECKLIPEYSEIAYRLEAIKFAETIGGKDITPLIEEDTK